ncbi:MAG: glycosyltransferase family 2 protein [Parvularculaceae bacterium]|nr:glycosyltransferase family 2 protein [Parvularculaceae bacterium]
MTDKPPLSAFIRTKNECRMIGPVVKAALAVADEVVVVDSGSTDDTIAIAEAAGARVVRQAWLGNGRQKRFAEDQCRHDWLLDLDADEVVTPALAGEIAALFASGAPPVRLYRTPVSIAPPVGPPWLGFGGVVRHKLYDRRAVRAPDHDAWDQFDLPPGEPVGALVSPILHYAFVNAAHLMEKLNRNSTTRAEALAPKPLPVLVLRIFFGLPFYVGKRYFLDGLFRGGVYGFAFSMMSGFGRWMRDVKMYERVMRERLR